MVEVFRINDRFHITGRGPVYMLLLPKDAVIQISDIFYDLHGNRFRVKGIEMIRRILLDVNWDEMPIGVMVELMDGVEAIGNILVRELGDVNFLFCNHPLYQKRVDEDYEIEFQSAGFEHACALFSYEDLELGKLSLYGERISGLTIYRGWMMKPEMYRLFYEKLEVEGIVLINTPNEYEKYHLLPKWYMDFKTKTPKSIWIESASSEELLRKVNQEEGSFIIKDYVKSRKHEWYDACYIPKIEEKDNSKKIIDNFVARQAEGLVGGLVLRKFVELKHIGFHDQSGMPISEEYRVFVYAGRVLAIDNYWTDKHNVDLSSEEYDWLDSIAAKMRSNFMTIDLARKSDGQLIIMELGDGQVSGLQQIIPQDFYSKGFGAN